MTRRQLALLAAGAAGATRAGAQAKYTGALDGFEDRVNMTSFDPVRFTLERHKTAPLRLTFKARNRAQAEAWQRQLRSRLTDLMGGFPAKKTPLEPSTLEVREFPGYRREKFVFESRPGVGVLGYLLTPKTGKAPFPAVVCVPGHGRGVDDIVGIDTNGQDRTERVRYQYDFAIQVVEHGMAAVAIEPMAFGCRRDPITKRRGLGVSACRPNAGAALLLGETIIAWRVWDIMRAIDWIETRKELDPRRVGCMGISGGGMCTTFAAALETRIRAAMISGYLNTFRDSILSLSHCMDNYVPGILNWAEMYDVAGLIAPRPLFVESGEKDDIFPVAASRLSFERVKKVYEVFGAAGMAEQEVFPAEHLFWGKRGLPFMARHLGSA